MRRAMVVWCGKSPVPNLLRGIAGLDTEGISWQAEESLRPPLHPHMRVNGEDIEAEEAKVRYRHRLGC